MCIKCNIFLAYRVQVKSCYALVLVGNGNLRKKVMDLCTSSKQYPIADKLKLTISVIDTLDK